MHSRELVGFTQLHLHHVYMFIVRNTLAEQQ